MIKSFPMSTFALILAFATLGKSYLPLFFVSLLLLLIMIIKLIVYPQLIIKELKNPLVLTLLSLVPMSITVLNSYFIDKNSLFTTLIWYLALGFFILSTSLFIINVIIKRNWHFILPSMFVNFVGIDVLVFNNPPTIPRLLLIIILIYSIIVYLCLLIAITITIFKLKHLNELNRPTLAIYAAPSSLITVALLSLNFDLPNIILYVLLINNIIKLCIYINIFTKTKFGEFKATFGCFTFPIVINSISFTKLNDALNLRLDLIAQIYEIISIIIVIFILLTYLNHALSVKINNPIKKSYD